MAGGVTCRAQACRRKADLAAHLALYRQAILGRIRPILVSHAVDLPLPPPLTTTAEPSRRRRWPSTACASLSARLQLGRRRAGRGHGGRPRRPRPAQPCGGLPTAALPNLTSAGHRGRGNARTVDAHQGPDARTPETSQRTPGRSDVRTGHWTPVGWTGKRGHWSLAPDTGRRTLAGDADRVTTTRPASRPPGPPRRVIVRWDAQLCSCGRDLRGSAAHAGSAVRSPAGARLPLALPCSARSLRRPRRASAHCSPRKMIAA
jgi:hypothetical protein